MANLKSNARQYYNAWLNPNRHHFLAHILCVCLSLHSPIIIFNWIRSVVWFRFYLCYSLVGYVGRHHSLSLQPELNKIKSSSTTQYIYHFPSRSVNGFGVLVVTSYWSHTNFDLLSNWEAQRNEWMKERKKKITEPNFFLTEWIWI